MVKLEQFHQYITDAKTVGRLQVASDNNFSQKCLCLAAATGKRHYDMGLFLSKLRNITWLSLFYFCASHEICLFLCTIMQSQSASLKALGFMLLGLLVKRG